MSLLLKRDVSIVKIVLPAKLLNSIVNSHFTYFGKRNISSFFSIAFVTSKNHFPQKKNQKSKMDMFDFFQDQHFLKLILSCLNLLKHDERDVSTSLLLKRHISMLPSCLWFCIRPMFSLPQKQVLADWADDGCKTGVSRSSVKEWAEWCWCFLQQGRCCGQ